LKARLLLIDSGQPVARLRIPFGFDRPLLLNWIGCRVLFGLATAMPDPIDAGGQANGGGTAGGRWMRSRVISA